MRGSILCTYACVCGALFHVRMRVCAWLYSMYVCVCVRGSIACAYACVCVCGSVPRTYHHIIEYTNVSVCVFMHAWYLIYERYFCIR